MDKVEVPAPRKKSQKRKEVAPSYSDYDVEQDVQDIMLAGRKKVVVGRRFQEVCMRH